MFNDCIKKDTFVGPGDIVYIYEYRNRNKIEFFEDLEKILVTDIIPRNKATDDIMVIGVKETIKDGHAIHENLTGIVEYIKKDDFVQTSQGNKIINYFIKDNCFHKCLRKQKEEFELCKLYGIFTIDKKIKIKFPVIEDILFTNQNDIQKLVPLLNIKYPRYHNGYVSYELNGVNKEVLEFEIYINNKKQNTYIKQDIFNWLCSNKNDINNTNFNFNKVFSMKLTGYEVYKK